MSQTRTEHLCTSTDTCRLNIFGQRGILHQDLSEAVSQLPAHTFFDDGGLLPPLPQFPESIDVNAILERLQGGTPKFLDESDRRRDLNESPDSESVGVAEDCTFDAGFPGTVDRIVEASGIEQSLRTLIFEFNQNGVTSANTLSDSSKTDYVGRLATATGDFSKHKWAKVAVPGICRRLDNLHKHDSIDDFEKILMSCKYILRDDPTRRFAFAFTIQGWSMRIWFVNRSDVFVSEPFDILEQQKHFVQFVLRLVFAEPYQLGWDPTMRQVPQAPARYDIALGDKTYRTLRILSNIGAEALRGRGTRVWEVRELSGDGKETGPALVLKDSWVDDGNTREGEILQEIAEDAIESGGRYSELVDRYFMKALTWGDVVYDGGRDNGFATTNRDRLLKKMNGEVGVKTNPTTRGRSICQNSVTGALPAPELEHEAQTVQDNARVHHRIIFTEVGKRLTELSSLAEVFDRLCDIVMGLSALHKGGRVHRDISVGNILVVDHIGKITDVEYASSEKTPISPGVRVGTSFFMSPEVEHSKYLYIQYILAPPATNPDTDNTDDGDPADSMYKIKARGGQDAAHWQRTLGISRSSNEGSNAEPQFRNNPLHDLESLFWVALWVLLCSEYLYDEDSGTTPEGWDACIAQHGHFAAKLFCDSLYRRDIMTLENRTFEKALKVLLPRVRVVGRALNKFRKLLMTAYRKAEAKLVSGDDVISFTVAKKLYPEIYQLFTDISVTLKAKDLTIIIKEGDTIPIKMINRAMNPEVVESKPKAGSGRLRSDDPEDHKEVLARPAKSRKTRAHQNAGRATIVLTPARRTRSQTGSLPRKGGE